MWFRLFSIIFLKWIANALAVFVSLRFFIPHAWQGFLKAAPIWALSFVIAFVFAKWAFAARFPTRRDLFSLMAMWVVVSYTLNIFGSVLLFQTARVALYGTDLHLASAWELLAILLAALLVRRQKLRAALGEGMEA